jgi:hypothetical protein
MPIEHTSSKFAFDDFVPFSSQNWKNILNLLSFLEKKKKQRDQKWILKEGAFEGKRSIKLGEGKGKMEKSFAEGGGPQRNHFRSSILRKRARCSGGGRKG